MASPAASKRKGYEWEAALRTELRETFPLVDPRLIERNGAHGQADRGDIRGVPLWTVEAKNVKTIDLSGFMRETETERQNAGDQYGVCLVKARRKPLADGYAVMTIGTWLRLAARLNELERATALG